MLIWRRSKTVTFKRIGKHYGRIEGYQDFAKYCMYSHYGEIVKANEASAAFLSSLMEASLEERREKVLELVHLEYSHSDIYHLFDRDLSALITGVLKEWVMENNEALPYRWLGVRCRSITYLNQALEIDPGDTIATKELIGILLSDLDYQTHHLTESVFLGSLEEAVDNLKMIEKLLDNLSRTSSVRKYLRSYNRYTYLVQAWVAYSDLEDKEDFPSWCRQHCPKFSFRNVFHYG